MRCSYCKNKNTEKAGKRENISNYWERALSRFVSKENLPEFEIVIEKIDELMEEIRRLDSDFK